MDEIDMPDCITVDFDSVESVTFALYDHDTTAQSCLMESEIFLKDFEEWTNCEVQV
jgi:glycyl-tRNA synthetase (class II)